MNAAPRPDAPRAQWVTFEVEGRRYALPLEAVIRVIRAVEITPLPLAPDAVAGAIDVGGRTIPVFDLRRRLRLRARPLALSDQFILARAARRDVALVVDRVRELVEARRDTLDERIALAGQLAHLSGVLALPDGMVLIEDLERFLTPSEDAALESALREAGGAHAR